MWQRAAETCRLVYLQKPPVPGSNWKLLDATSAQRPSRRPARTAVVPGFSFTMQSMNRYLMVLTSFPARFFFTIYLLKMLSLYWAG